MTALLYTPPLLDQHTMLLGTQHDYPFELHSFCGATGSASAVWPTANLAMYLPLYVRTPLIVSQLWWLNGTVVSAPSMEMAIYNEPGTVKLATTGVVTQVTNDLPQAVTITGGLLLVPGRYWMGLICANNTSGIRRWTNTAGAGNSQKLFAMQQQQMGSTALPASTTFAAAVNAFIPHLGVNAIALAM